MNNFYSEQILFSWVGRFRQKCDFNVLCGDLNMNVSPNIWIQQSKQTSMHTITTDLEYSHILLTTGHHEWPQIVLK